MGPYSLGEIANAVMIMTVVSLPLVVTLWALLDAARRPSWVWALVGRSQLLWLWLLGMSLLTVYGGLLAAALYFFRVRGQLARAESGDIGPLADS